MRAHSGEPANATGDFRCARCHRPTHVVQGKPLPECPHCGNGTYSDDEAEARDIRIAQEGLRTGSGGPITHEDRERELSEPRSQR